MSAVRLDWSGQALDAQSAAALADELVDLTGLLSNLAFDLGSDPHTLRRHVGSLQAIDLITQIQVALSDILRSTGPIADRVAAVPVEALAARLRARLSGLPVAPYEPPVADDFQPFE